MGGLSRGDPAPQKFLCKAQRQFQEAWAAWLTWAVKRRRSRPREREGEGPRLASRADATSTIL